VGWCLMPEDTGKGRKIYFTVYALFCLRGRLSSFAPKIEIHFAMGFGALLFSYCSWLVSVDRLPDPMGIAMSTRLCTNF
jgi:hypothetical protein